MLKIVGENLGCRGSAPYPAGELTTLPRIPRLVRRGLAAPPQEPPLRSGFSARLSWPPMKNRGHALDFNDT